MRSIVGFLLCLSAIGCATSSSRKAVPFPADNFIWLEDSKNPNVVEWSKAHNAKVEKQLGADPRAVGLASEIRKIATAKDRIPMPSLHAGKIRNFWQDADHVRGIWRETTLVEYQKTAPKWDVLLDLDALNKIESQSLVFEGATCLPPADDLCLIKLSDAGRDEVEVREFQVSKKTFVVNGFKIPPAKTDVSWIDRDHLFIGTNFGPDSLTTSGYPRQVRIWTRGEPLVSSKIIFEGNQAHVAVQGFVIARPELILLFVQDSSGFYESENYLYGSKGELTKVPFPETANFLGAFQGQLLAQLRQDWKTESKTFLAGSVVSLPLRAIDHAKAKTQLETLFTPDGKTAFSELQMTKNFIELAVLNNVRSEIRQISRKKNKWVTTKVNLPDAGTLAIHSVDAFDAQDRLFSTYETFTEPTALYFGEGGKELKKVKQLPARFDASEMTFEQFMATSKDGTKVPYFVVHKKAVVFNGENPTLLYGYGGFENSLRPFYMNSIGKVWLEKGGVYVLSNIRGGGEFGPRWHEAALKENRQRAYDDFASIAEDLFKRRITSPRRLGIQGGSNGGLLVGVAVTQHPEYYRAVVCESALLDMLRYTKLPPGASWMSEYGDPDDPKMAAVIAAYSPYQNVKLHTKYPKIFFHISTADDRVQPGHTRKMVARLEEDGNDVLMFENTEGGHGGAADIEQRVKKSTLEYTYLYQQLRD